MSRARPCRICRKWFRPDPRAGDRQRVCSAEVCQRERHRRACASWHTRNPGYDEEERLRRRLRREVPVAVPDPLARAALTGMDLEVTRDAVGLQVAVVLEEAARLLWSGVRDAVALQPLGSQEVRDKVLPSGPRDAMSERPPPL